MSKRNNSKSTNKKNAFGRSLSGIGELKPTKRPADESDSKNDKKSKKEE